MEVFIFVLKVICILADIGFSIILIYFMRETDDRASLIGFGSLLGTLFLNSAALLMG